MEKHIKYTLSDLGGIVTQLIALPSCRVFALTGALGAGKTTLVQAMLKQLGVKGAVTSPTYTYVNIYDRVVGYTNVYHFDLYRLDQADAFVQMGFDEYLHDPDALVIVEWPECIAQLLPDDTCSVDIQHIDEATRLAVIDIPGEKHE